jgi:hypothetical protein
MSPSSGASPSRFPAKSSSSSKATPTASVNFQPTVDSIDDRRRVLTRGSIRALTLSLNLSCPRRP